MKWNKMSEVQPKEGSEILFYDGYAGVFLGEVFKEAVYYESSGVWNIDFEAIEYWMYLPEKPGG